MNVGSLITHIDGGVEPYCGDDNERKYRVLLEPECRNCGSKRLFSDDRGDKLCIECGRIFGCGTYYLEPTDNRIPSNGFYSPGYKRKFYFNERISRWCCQEPRIPEDVKQLILVEATKEEKYGNLKTRCNRTLINSILRNVNLSDEFQEKYRSKKFKKSKFTPKRFYDKVCVTIKIAITATANTPYPSTETNSSKIIIFPSNT